MHNSNFVTPTRSQRRCNVLSTSATDMTSGKGSHGHKLGRTLNVPGPPTDWN